MNPKVRVLSALWLLYPFLGYVTVWQTRKPSVTPVQSEKVNRLEVRAEREWVRVTSRIRLG